MIYLFIYLTPLANILLFEAYFFRADFFYIAVVISDLLLILAVAMITGKKIKSADFWNFCIFPVIFSSALAAYSLLIVNHILIQGLFALNLVLIVYYLRNIYRGEKTAFLENISSYGNFLAVFFSFSVIFGLKAFLNASIWVLVLAAAAVIILVIHEILWSYKVNFKSALPFIFIGCLVVAQIAWAIYFLPFNFNTLGLILTIGYYVMIGLIKANFGAKLTARNLRHYIISGLSCLIIVLLTAKWA